MKAKTTLLFVLFVQMIFAQSYDRKYQSMDYLHELTKDTIILDSLNALERILDEHLRFAEAKDHILPVVFHILFSDEEDRIDQELIHRQMQILNNDFGGRTKNVFLEQLSNKLSLIHISEPTRPY